MGGGWAGGEGGGGRGGGEPYDRGGGIWGMSKVGEVHGVCIMMGIGAKAGLGWGVRRGRVWSGGLVE